MMGVLLQDLWKKGLGLGSRGTIMGILAKIEEEGVRIWIWNRFLASGFLGMLTYGFRKR